jgi:hypothetical protein
MSAAPYDLTFFAPGVPAPKGSLDAVPVGRWAADDSIDVEQFATAAFRVLRARKNALKADGE